MQERSDRRREVLPLSPSDRRWFVHVAEKTYGPYSGSEIKRLAAEGRITESGWLFPEGGSAWIEAKNEPTLGSLFRPSASPPQSPPSEAAWIAQPRDQMPDPLTVASAANSALGAGAKPWWKRFRGVPSPLFQRADQESVREDLREFFGPRADKYLAIYEKMRSSGRAHVRSWNWIVFFTTFPWFFYRKMYIWGALLIFLPLLLGYLFGLKGNAGAMASMSVIANSQYVTSALRRVQNADELGLTGSERRDYLRRAGGVSIIAGILSGTLFAAIVALAILSAYLGHKSTH